MPALHSFEQLYDGLWARRHGGEVNGSACKATAREGAEHDGRLSTAAELAHLQRRVADLAAELEVS